MDTTWREELAWAAGFFDGEGSVYTTGERHHSIKLAIHQVDRAVLDRFRRAVGVGTISGPYPPRGPQRRAQYKYQAAGQQRVQAVIALLWQWLGAIKRDQSAVALRRERAWRSRCPHGIIKHKRTALWAVARCLACRRDRQVAIRADRRRRRWAQMITLAVAKLPWRQPA